MKKGKLVLTAMVVVAAIGSAFAINAKKFNPSSVYYKPQGASTYTLIACTTNPIPTPLCSYAQTQNGAYYTFSAGVYTVIPDATPLRVPNAQ